VRGDWDPACRIHWNLPTPHRFAKPRNLWTTHSRFGAEPRGGWLCQGLGVAEFTHRLSGNLQDRSLPPEVNRLGRTIARWATQITNWHHSAVTNGPTEGLNNLIKSGDFH